MRVISCALEKEKKRLGNLAQQVHFGHIHGKAPKLISPSHLARNVTFGNKRTTVENAIAKTESHKCSRPGCRDESMRLRVDAVSGRAECDIVCV
jgi:hypothetical protein